jgi:hypothetical protein
MTPGPVGAATEALQEIGAGTLNFVRAFTRDCPSVQVSPPF